MNKLIRNSALILVLLISMDGAAQLGYLGKRTALELGVGSNYGVINSTSLFYDYEVQDKLLMPKLTFGLHREKKNGTSLHWQAIYHPLPNSHVSTLRLEESVGFSSRKVDTAWTKSDNLQFSLGFRRYAELAPLGLYFEFMLKGNVVFNKTLFHSELEDTYSDINFYEKTVSYNEASGVTMIPEIGMAIGSTYPINNKFLLDYGGKLNFVLGKFRNRGGDLDQLPSSDDLHRIVSSKKLFPTNLLEIYVNIILFP